jgi:hypothetical protein
MLLFNKVLYEVQKYRILSFQRGANEKKYLNLKSKYLNFAALKQNFSIKIF